MCLVPSYMGLVLGTGTCTATACRSTPVNQSECQIRKLVFFPPQGMGLVMFTGPLILRTLPPRWQHPDPENFLRKQGAVPLRQRKTSARSHMHEWVPNTCQRPENAFSVDRCATNCLFTAHGPLSQGHGLPFALLEPLDGRFQHYPTVHLVEGGTRTVEQALGLYPRESRGE